MSNSKFLSLGRAALGRYRLLALGAVVVVGGVAAWGHGRHRVPAGVFIGDVALGGLTMPEAKSAIADFVVRRQRQQMSFAGESGTCLATMEQLGAVVDVAATEFELSRLWKERQGFHLWFSPAVMLQLRPRLDPSRLTKWLADCESRAISDRPIEGNLLPKDGDFVIHPSRSGRRIAAEKLEALVGEALGRTDDALLPLPIVDQVERPTRAALERARTAALDLVSKAVVLKAEATHARLTLLRLDIAKLLEWQTLQDGELEWHISRSAFDHWLGSRRHRVEQRARDATYEVKGREQLVVIPEQNGSLIAVDQLFAQLEQALRDGKRQLDIPFAPTEAPTRFVSDLEPLNIHEPVGEFTTRHACCQPRVNNIHRIADIINGTIVLPGATFSLNERVGQRSLENGFVPAPSIEDGEMVDTIGGGVSQFATTFYNAVLRGGYEIHERQAHTYWFDRYPMGHEATLSWPKPDVVIRNDTASGLLILATYTERSITIRLFGDREARRVDISVSPRFDIVRPTTEYLPSIDQDPEKERVKDGGCIGWSVWTMRTVTLKDGTIKKDRRKVIYKPKIRRVEVHPCKIPKGEPGHTGEKCPEPTTDTDGAPSSGEPVPG